MSKKLFAGIVSAIIAVIMLATAGTAYAVNTYRIGGVTDRQYIATSTDAWMVPGPNTWQAVPATSLSLTITGSRKLITARFGAESLCQGPGWCSVRVVYTSGGPLTELAPQSGSDYAFDSAGSPASWSQHALERTSAVYLPPGTYRVSVQAMRVNAASFRLDDYHLNVATIAP